MDQGILVSGDLWEGADLVQKLGQSWPVKAAFWLRETDDERGYLYIAIEGIARTGFRLVFRKIAEITRDTPYPNFDDDRIRPIDATDPRARAAIELNERYPDPKGHRTGPIMFGDVFAEDIYVYPTSTPAAVG